MREHEPCGQTRTAVVDYKVKGKMPNLGDATDAVTSFLRALEAGDIEPAMERLAPDAVWINVTLPTVRGRERIERLCQLGLKIGGPTSGSTPTTSQPTAPSS